MKTYLLKDIPDETWQRVRARAKAEGHTIKWVLLDLVARYGGGEDVETGAGAF